MTTTPKPQAVQGEGNTEADRHYRDATQAFVDAGKVQPAADAAAPESAEVARELLEAERAGLAHAKK